MTPELFPPSSMESPSPKLRRMRKHGLKTIYHEYVAGIPEWVCTKEGFADRMGFGAEEDDAIADWACRAGVKLWNEEEQK